jgi:hypothetical protein
MGDAARVDPARPPAAMYFVVVAARSGAALPVVDATLSLFTDRAESELARIDDTSREVMRQDNLVRERDAALDRQTWHIRHLEDIALSRERIVMERDAQLAQLHALREAEAAAAREEHDGLADSLASSHREVAAQERIIAYRQSARWWIMLPWFRVRLWWQRVRGT